MVVYKHTNTLNFYRVLMKKILIAIGLLQISVCANAMTKEEADYLKEYPKATKATLILDYLFIEDDEKNILDQCFITKEKNKICNLNHSQKLEKDTNVLPAFKL